MHIKVLGSAAGGGLPQWNCSCANCLAASSKSIVQGMRVRPRTQTQVALSANHRSWTLLNCSPDLREQIQATPELHSQPVNGIRHSPITGAVFTSADIDCILGLLHLREQQPLDLYSTGTVNKIVRADNSIFRMLEQKPEQARWKLFQPGSRIDLDSNGAKISVHAVATGGDLPYYVRREHASDSPADAVTGLIIKAQGSTATFAFLPGVREISDDLLQQLQSCDLLLMDGTFWSDDELIRVQGAGRTARQMGHLPVSGHDGSIRRLNELKRPRKIFIHMNNTNPMLNENGDEYRQVHDSGWELAVDGMEFHL